MGVSWCRLCGDGNKEGLLCFCCAHGLEHSEVKDHDAWMEEVQEWAESHPQVENVVDDSRESVYR